MASRKAFQVAVSIGMQFWLYNSKLIPTPNSYPQSSLPII
jgi:hypothetical protein